jgi:hypothetical protein
MCDSHCHALKLEVKDNRGRRKSEMHGHAYECLTAEDVMSSPLFGSSCFSGIRKVAWVNVEESSAFEVVGATGSHFLLLNPDDGVLL